jgi:hypothetical protein
MGLKRAVDVSRPQILNTSIFTMFYKQFIIGLIKYLPYKAITYKYRKESV